MPRGDPVRRRALGWAGRYDAASGAVTIVLVAGIGSESAQAVPR